MILQKNEEEEEEAWENNLIYFDMLFSRVYQS